MHTLTFDKVKALQLQLAASPSARATQEQVSVHSRKYMFHSAK